MHTHKVCSLLQVTLEMIRGGRSDISISAYTDKNHGTMHPSEFRNNQPSTSCFLNFIRGSAVSCRGEPHCLKKHSLG